MKQSFADLLSRDFNVGSFPLASKIFDLGREAEVIAKLAQEKIDEEGKFAQVHCSNVLDWMNAIAETAQKALDLHLEENQN